MIRQSVLQRAADLLIEQAAVMRSSHTIRGRWPPRSPEHKQFVELVRLANRLRRIDREVRG